MKKLIFSFFLLLSFVASAQVGIGTNTPDNSAMLEVNSTNRGLLTPRMTLSQRNAITSGENGHVDHPKTEYTDQLFSFA